MPVKLSDKKVRFIDNGLFSAFVRRIAPEFGEVSYYSPWQDQFPDSRHMKLADGFKEFRRVNYPLMDADKVDLWVFLDVFHADLQVFLANRGHRVWGARFGEEMELERWDFHNYLKKIGLPVPHAELIVGIDNLVAYLKDKKDKFIKNNFARGDMETWKFKNMLISEWRLNNLRFELGPFGVDYEFIVEDELPNRVEIGYDGFSIDGLFPNVAMMAYEIKGIGMIGVTLPYDKLPKPVLDVNRALVPALRGHEYRGFLCTEIRYGADKKPYLIDPCCRLGSPSNELLQELFSGWGMTLWDGAEGRMTPPRIEHKYGAIVMVYSEEGDKLWQPLEYPSELDRWVKLRNAYALGKRRYSVPQRQAGNLAGVVGVGETLERANAHARSNAEKVEGQLLEVSVEALDKGLEVIREGEKYGIHFGSNGVLKDVKSLARS